MVNNVNNNATYIIHIFQFSSVQFSHSVVSYSLRPHELQHSRPPCSSPTPGVHPNPCPLSRWCHPTISSSVIPFSSCPQSFPASGSFPMSQFFASGGQSIGVSASTSVLPMNIQDWAPVLPMRNSRLWLVDCPWDHRGGKWEWLIKPEPMGLKAEIRILFKF